MVTGSATPPNPGGSITVTGGPTAGPGGTVNEQGTYVVPTPGTQWQFVTPPPGQKALTLYLIPNGGGQIYSDGPAPPATPWNITVNNVPPGNYTAVVIGSLEIPGTASQFITSSVSTVAVPQSERPPQ